MVWPSVRDEDMLANVVSSLTSYHLIHSNGESKCMFRFKWKLKLGKLAYTRHDAGSRLSRQLQKPKQPLVHSMQVIVAGSPSITCLEMIQ